MESYSLWSPYQSTLVSGKKLPWRAGLSILTIGLYYAVCQHTCVIPDFQHPNAEELLYYTQSIKLNYSYFRKRLQLWSPVNFWHHHRNWQISHNCHTMGRHSRQQRIYILQVWTNGVHWTEDSRARWFRKLIFVQLLEKKDHWLYVIYVMYLLFSFFKLYYYL